MAFELQIMKISQFFISEKKRLEDTAPAKTGGCMLAAMRNKSRLQGEGEEYEYIKGTIETALNVKPTILEIIQSEMLCHKVLRWGVTYKYNMQRLL